ncbi:AAA family ATPase [Nocardioides sp. WV_118_6]
MLRRIDVKKSWRSLTPGFWPTSRALGSHTVIYGHNGSGKSTLAELLLQVSEGRAEVEVLWEAEDQKRVSVPPGGACPVPDLAVFTRRWVEANLSGLLEGQSAPAILTLGKAAIEAKGEEEALEASIAAAEGDLAVAQAAKKEAEAASERVARGVQDRVASQLEDVDHRRFSRRGFMINKARERLATFSGAVPSEREATDALKRLADAPPAALRDTLSPPPGTVADLRNVLDLLESTPTRAVLGELESDPRGRAWVQNGLALHEARESCLFCSGAISVDRRERLAQFFDESWMEIRGNAQRLQRLAADAGAALSSWVSGLPPAEHLVVDVRGEYEEQMQRLGEEVAARMTALQELVAALDAKVADPAAVPPLSEWSVLEAPLSTAALARVLADHNDHVARHEEAVEQRIGTVLDHLVGSEAAAFRSELDAVRAADEALRQISEQVDEARRKLSSTQQQRFTSSEMARTLTADLAQVYGKHHLSIEVTNDGKSYHCRRGSLPAQHLSEGERTTLSLLYFLRKLEEKTIATAPSLRTVVIDDPSSSLDRETVFATHQWLVERLKGFGQVVVLTHDFNLLRLFVRSEGSAWGRSLNRIKDGDLAEKRFPTTSFLELYAGAPTAGAVEAVRRTQVAPLPTLLRKTTTEYAYLFSTVMGGLANPGDEHLFLLPNATRRVLEIFASYKVPHLQKFDQQMAALLKERSIDDPFRDVYFFCNKYSHGEGGEVIDILDAKAVHRQIRRCMAFLRLADPTHFAHMCKATEVDESVLDRLD